MTVRQKILKAIYPALMFFNKKAGKHDGMPINNIAMPPISIYTLTEVLNNGDELKLDNYQGKKLLFVNTASDCGYTAQYADLEKLYQMHRDKLVILAFPANDFKSQETADDESIAGFCKLNYGITFPLMKKSIVVKEPGQNKIFQWLTDKNKNGWNSKPPTWNFCKYLVDENGRLTHIFLPGTSPIGDEMLNVINK